MQKAIKWLDAKKLAYKFHDYKVAGIDKDTIGLWLQHFPVDKLVNLRSTTWKELPEDERSAISSKPGAIALMMKYNSIIKRPVWDMGNGAFFLGWDETKLEKLV